MYDWRADVEGLSELRQPWEQYGVQTSCGARLRDDRRWEAGGARTSSMRQPQAKHQLRSTASIVGIEGSRGREDEERVGRGRGGGASEEEGALWDDYKQMDVDLDRAALGPKLWYRIGTPDLASFNYFSRFSL